MSDKILIVDDEKAVRFFVAAGLTRAGWQVDQADSGEAALALLKITSYDVILLDLRMVGIDGVTVMRQAKEYWPETMVIILTAYATVDSAIEAVRQGAYDYLRKPCDVSEIVACANRALLEKKDRVRQGQMLDQPETISGVEAKPQLNPTPGVQTGTLFIDFTAHTALLAGQFIFLTPTEFKLLEILAKALGQPVSLDRLVQEGLGYDSHDPQLYETVRVHISNLRSKLGGDYIRTLRGSGYILIHLPATSPKTTTE